MGNERGAYYSRRGLSHFVHQLPGLCMSLMEPCQTHEKQWPCPRYLRNRKFHQQQDFMDEAGKTVDGGIRLKGLETAGQSGPLESILMVERTVLHTSIT